MNCIVIDDDKLSCKVVAEYIKRTATLTLTGIFENAIEARNELLARNDIDLIFLDVHMPEMDGFDFIRSLENPPSIIIVSTSDNLALKAYDFDVLDYIVKPVNYSRFCKAVDKVSRYLNKDSSEGAGQKEIFIKKGSTLVKIKLNDIIIIEALENYVVLHTDSEKFTIHFTMKAIEQQLPSFLFIRVHRSFIVNKSRINMIRDNALEISGYKELGSIPIGKSYREMLLKEINVMLR